MGTHTLMWWASLSQLIFIMFGQSLLTKSTQFRKAPWHQNVFKLFSPCLEVSIWNLLYTSNRWCGTSSLSFIAIGTLWPTLQPKRNNIHIDLSSLGHTYMGRCRSGRLSTTRKFPGLFHYVFICQPERWFIYSVGRITFWVKFAPESGPCDLFHILSLGRDN